MKILITLITILMCSTFATADTLYVPDHHTTIQAAIDAAITGDTIIVRDGTYTENINFKGKDITLASENGPDSTVIDGGNPIDPDIGSVVTFESGETTLAELTGFTLTNGTGSLFEFYSGFESLGGGGILCLEASPTCTRNIITGNYAIHGGGFFCQDSSMVIANNMIKENAALIGYSGNSGAGIACYQSSPMITGNTITGNVAPSHILHSTGGGVYIGACTAIVTHNTIADNYAASGGGISCWGSYMTIENNDISENMAVIYGGVDCFSGEAVIVGNTITGNHADSGGGGGLTCRYTTSADISNNMITENEAGVQGGGVWLRSTSSTMTANTIAANTTSAFGGGIFCHDVEAVITNTIFWDNIATHGPELYLDHSYGPSSLDIDYSDVEGGLASCHVEPGYAVNWGVMTIDINPAFADAAAGDFHLTYGSPCRNSGDNSATSLLLDFEGDPRIAWAGTVDMGADEFYTHLYCTGDFTPGGSIDGKFVGLPGTTPLGLFLGSGELDPPVTTMWGNFHLEAPWFLIPLGVSIPSDGVLEIPATIPASPVAPYDVYMQALIGLTPDSLTNLFHMEIR